MAEAPRSLFSGGVTGRRDGGSGDGGILGQQGACCLHSLIRHHLVGLWLRSWS